MRQFAAVKWLSFLSNCLGQSRFVRQQKDGDLDEHASSLSQTLISPTMLIGSGISRSVIADRQRVSQFNRYSRVEVMLKWQCKWDIWMREEDKDWYQLMLVLLASWLGMNGFHRGSDRVTKYFSLLAQRLLRSGEKTQTNQILSKISGFLFSQSIRLRHRNCRATIAISLSSLGWLLQLFVPSSSGLRIPNHFLGAWKTFELYERATHSLQKCFCST